MRQKETEATLTELRKTNEITKQSLVKYQTETVKLIQQKKYQKKLLQHFSISTQ